MTASSEIGGPFPGIGRPTLPFQVRGQCGRYANVTLPSGLVALRWLPMPKELWG